MPSSYWPGSPAYGLFHPNSYKLSVEAHLEILQEKQLEPKLLQTLQISRKLFQDGVREYWKMFKQE